MSSVYIQLGAYGDICAMLPFFHLRYRKTNLRPVRVTVAEAYADIFDGVSYVEPILFPGHYGDLEGAMRWTAEKRIGIPTPTQVYGNRAGRLEDSFIKDMWNLAGRPLDWDAWDPLFDRRVAEREAPLIESFKGKPTILVCFSGKSSPWPHEDPIPMLRENFPNYNIVDLSTIKAERPYDLIGLYDFADLLISIDTMHLHMSRASKIPVMAFVTDKPDAWHGTPPYRNQMWRRTYSGYPACREAMIKEIQTFFGDSRATVTGKLIHVYSEAPGNNLRRHRMAQKSWEREYEIYPKWERLPTRDEDMPRNSKTEFADTRTLPFVKDVIDRACGGRDPDDIIVLTNDDVCFVEGATQRILHAVRDCGSCYAHRWEVHRLHRLLRPDEIRKQETYEGVDLFAFPVSWWRARRDEYPDMLIGYEAWDWIMTLMVQRAGGLLLNEFLYHERHQAPWIKGRHVLAGNKHNRRLAREWARPKGYDCTIIDID